MAGQFPRSPQHHSPTPGYYEGANGGQDYNDIAEQYYPHNNSAGGAGVGGPTTARYAPVGNLDLAGQSNYSFNDSSNAYPHPGTEMYEDGEHSPLTANAAAPAGRYPPQMQQHQLSALGQHPSFNASQASFLKEDPYSMSHHQSTDYLPPAGFSASTDGRPYNGRQSSTNSDAEWQRRARMPTRGKTMKVKLGKQGNFVHDYPVPGPIRNSVEAKWLAMGELLD